MNPIPSHESYMRRMAAVTAVGAHQPTDTKRNLGFVLHAAAGIASKWEMRASGPLSADTGDPRSHGSSLCPREPLLDHRFPSGSASANFNGR